MQTDPITASAPLAPTSPSATPPAAITSDFQTFLEMLTTQMENQDPLNPLESTDFAVQLATFSGVEQQVQTNQLLSALAGQMTTSGMVDLAGWVGREVRSTAPARFDGAPITLYPTVAPDTERMELVVRNAQGAELERYSVPATSDPVVWAGAGQNGQIRPNGTYSFEFVSTSAGDTTTSNPAETYSTVREVRRDRGDVFAVLDSGAQVPIGDVSAVRAPQEPL